MPVTGVKVTVYHCDAGAMANVVPNLDYGRCFLLCSCIHLMLVDYTGKNHIYVLSKIRYVSGKRSVFSTKRQLCHSRF